MKEVKHLVCQQKKLSLIHPFPQILEATLKISWWSCRAVVRKREIMGRQKEKWALENVIAVKQLMGDMAMASQQQQQQQSERPCQQGQWID